MLHLVVMSLTCLLSYNEPLSPPLLNVTGLLEYWLIHPGPCSAFNWLLPFCNL